MHITQDHWLYPAVREIVSGGVAMNIRRCLVMHFTAGATASSSIDFWRTPAARGASAHIVVDRDGAIFQCRPFNRTCGHAGVSRWKDPKTGNKFVGCNSFSIGIEIANAGDNEALANRWTNLPLVFAKHRNESRVKKWEAYPKAQIAAVIDLSRVLVARYNLDDITGHDCIAPERKNDPGPAFPMERIREACGFSGLPVVHKS